MAESAWTVGWIQALSKLAQIECSYMTWRIKNCRSVTVLTVFKYIVIIIFLKSNLISLSPLWPGLEWVFPVWVNFVQLLCLNTSACLHVWSVCDSGPSGIMEKVMICTMPRVTHQHGPRLKSQVYWGNFMSGFSICAMRWIRADERQRSRCIGATVISGMIRDVCE